RSPPPAPALPRPPPRGGAPPPPNPAPPAYTRQVGNEEFARRPIGTGPYRVTSFVRDEAVVMEANPNYWRGAPAIRRVTWRTIPEATARIAAPLTNEAQLIEGVPADQVQLFQRSPDVQLVQVRNGGLTIYLGLKTAEAPLNDARVRQALSLAIDRQALVHTLLRDFATATGTQASAFDFGYLATSAP